MARKFLTRRSGHASNCSFASAASPAFARHVMGRLLRDPYHVGAGSVAVHGGAVWPGLPVPGHSADTARAAGLGPLPADRYRDCQPGRLRDGRYITHGQPVSDPYRRGRLLLFRNSGIYLRWVFPCLCFAGLVFFANSPLTFTRLELLPSDISQFGHALNSITAMALTLGVLAIFRDEQKFKVELHSALARALARRELCTYLQPQVCAQGRVIGAEALLRWDRPGHGIQSPAEFIPVAEQSGLIHDIGLMVLEQACRQLREWSEHSDAQHWKLSVNVSPLQLTSSTFVEEVREIVHKFNIPANRLRLEITESVFASDLVATVMKMEDLRSDGISWSLDDFGTGFSSLALLRELPLDELKIDRSFIAGIESDKGKYELIRKIIEIAEILNISTVAEGVETEAQFDCLQAMGCAAFQGFYFGRPMIAAQFIGKYAAS